MMLDENEAREALIDLAKKYLADDPDLSNLIDIINDRSRPGLPVRGVLESMRSFRKIEYSDADKELIEELIYLYG